MTWIEQQEFKPVVPKAILGTPRFLDAERDFGVHYGYMSDGQFVAAHVTTDDGIELAFMVHLMLVNPPKLPDAYPVLLDIVSLTDLTNNAFMFEERAHQNDFSFSTEGLDLKCPTGSLRGDTEKLSLRAVLPQGRGTIAADLTAQMPALYNCVQGTFPFLSGDVEAFQYGIPSLRVEGTLILDGKSRAISGEAWLDRQWGDGSEDFVKRTFKWKWMNLNLDNGYKMSVWDVVVNGRDENAWATIVSPKGAHTVVDIVPFSAGEGDQWTSPATRQVYPTSFAVEMPAVDAKFFVKVAGPLEQEIVSQVGEHKYEAACKFTGHFMGRPVSGFNYLELVGSFR